MRILVIAYEFPPSPSPQSLRWKHLSAELARQGHEVHVLTVDAVATGAAPPDGVVVHRVFPGVVVGGIAALGRWRRARGRDRTRAGEAATSQVHENAPSSAPMSARLNWKGRALVQIQRIAAWIYYPDIRGEWRPFARARLLRLLDELQPDVVVSSHEPATTLQLGLIAKARGFRWIADLGDPVLCFYTERRWRRRALRLERRVCNEADRVTVTTESARTLLRERHGAGRIDVLTQGFDARREALPHGVAFDPRRLELLFTGSFYRFRRAGDLLEAVARSPRVRLNVATARLPDEMQGWFERFPQQFRLLGFLEHGQAVAVQRAADVLVNIANDDPVHVPGKIFEYLGARRPILHLGDDPGDAAAQMVATRNRGVVVRQARCDIAAALQALVALKDGQGLDSAFDLGAGGLEAYSWEGLGHQLADLLESVRSEVAA